MKATTFSCILSLVLTSALITGCEKDEPQTPSSTTTTGSTSSSTAGSTTATTSSTSGSTAGSTSGSTSGTTSGSTSGSTISGSTSGTTSGTTSGSTTSGTTTTAGSTSGSTSGTTSGTTSGSTSGTTTGTTSGSGNPFISIGSDTYNWPSVTCSSVSGMFTMNTYATSSAGSVTLTVTLGQYPNTSGAYTLVSSNNNLLPNQAHITAFGTQMSNVLNSAGGQLNVLYFNSNVQVAFGNIPTVTSSGAATATTLGGMFSCF